MQKIMHNRSQIACAWSALQFRFRRMAGGFIPGLLVFCLFFSYPLALLVPVNTFAPLVFHLSLPTTMWLSLLSVCFLLTTPLAGTGSRGFAEKSGCKSMQAGPLLQFLFLGIIVLGAVSAWLGKTARIDSYFSALAVFSIPFFCATCPRQLLPRRLILWLGCLWLVHAGHALWQWRAPFEAVGIAGNRNWQAALTAALTPWAWLLARKCRGAGNAAATGNRKRLRAGLLAWLLMFLISVAALWLLYLGASRGVWLVLGIYVFLSVLSRSGLSRGTRYILPAALLMLVVAGVFMYPQPFLKAIGRDIRLPMWAQTVKMIRDRPWLGAGPGNYRREFVKYRSDAHRQREVAAAVTEHPHNEALHTAAIFGLPLLAVWLLLLVPLLKFPVRAPPYLQTLHFSAFMIFGTAMFDKTLFQPPVNLVGLLCLGLLWRPLLPVRAQPRRRRPPLRQLWRPVAVCAFLFGLMHGYREFNRSSLMRSGLIAEAAAAADAAYHFYSEAARRFPQHVQPHVFAGNLAAMKLRNPQLALAHFTAARQLEPDFAHLNGQIGVALGMLGRHQQALAYFERNVRLHGFNPTAVQQLYMCRLAAGQTDGILELAEWLARLRLRQCRAQLGEEEMLRLAVEFLEALQKNRAAAALTAATALIAPLELGYAEPAFIAMRQDTEIPQDLSFAGFTEADFTHWMSCRFWQRLAAEQKNSTPESLLNAFRKLQIENAGAEKSPAPGSVVSRIAENAAGAFADFAVQAGYQAVVVGGLSPDSKLIVELRLNNAVWLISVERGIVASGKSVSALLKDAELCGELGVIWAAEEQARLLIPAVAADFFMRNQALGQLLRLLLKDVAPIIGLSPSLRLLHYQQLLRPAPVRADEADTQPLKIEFCRETFSFK